MTKDFEFLLHMQRLMFEAEALAKQYDVEDRFISIMFAGLVDPLNGNISKLNAMYSYNIQDIDELLEIQDFIFQTYDIDDKDELDNRDLGNLLDGTGIELE
jgi:hypothetical protein|tara:strand:- start:542 stop:844 length:303 start_codon:yes stop_codon:yes gene_type:complete